MKLSTGSNRAILKKAAASLLVAVAAPVWAQYSTPMRDVENPDRSMFMLNASGTLDPPFVNGFVFFPTPSGKRYFIEQVTLTCTLSSTADSITQVFVSTRQTVTGGSLGYSSPALTLQYRGPAPFGGSLWSGTANVRMFSDPDPFTTGGGSSIALNIFHTAASTSASCSGFISGHSLVL